MASGQTQYYELNQWEAADQVLRTEFNADNQKIDGALKAMRDLIVSPSVLNAVLDLSLIHIYRGPAGAGRLPPV